MSARPRLDELLVARGLFDDLHAAKAAVLAGEVVVGEHRETQAGRRLDADAPIRLKAGKEKDRLGYVSRGGAKLERALDVFALDVAGLSCVDLGASSGGFTDCLLQRGAAHVSAVDVGTNQFAWELRTDGRVSVFERTDVRGIDVGAVGGPFDLAVADLSFVRLEAVLADAVRLLRPGGSLVSLVKPQFEVAKDEIGAHGVVSDPAAQARAVAGVVGAAREAGLEALGLTYSPVRGAKGNIEFLLWSRRAVGGPQAGSAIVDADVRRVVDEAHARLGGAQ